jgi:hypothetical protein
MEASPMATNDLIPLFLSDHTEELEQPVIGKARHRAAISSRILKTSILVVTAAAIVFAIRLVGNPLVLFTNATASLVGTSASQDGAGQSTPTIQSTVDAQALPPTAREAPTGDDIAAASSTADQSQTENPQPVASLFKQYQAWAAEEDARTHVRPVQKRARPAVNARAEVRPARNARAKVVQNARAQVRREQNVRVGPVQNTQAQVQPDSPSRANRSRHDP